MKIRILKESKFTTDRYTQTQATQPVGDDISHASDDIQASRM